MNFPNPLHPAIVHFPIVLIIVGTVAAIVTLCFPRAAFAWFSAVFLALAAAGAVAATWSGDEDGEKAEHAGAAAKQVFEEHEEWGERARNAAILAALAAGVAAVSLRRLPVFSRGVAALTGAVALGATWCVIEAGHYGGQLVYQHGVGVSHGVPTASVNPLNGKKSRHRNDD